PSVVVFEQAGTILAMAVEVGDRDVFHQIGQPFPVAADLQTTVERVPVEQKDIPLVHAQWLEPGGPVHLVEVIERAAIRCHSTRRGDAFSQDRKSTRLNSSHDQTSYAVFCLKKK